MLETNIPYKSIIMRCDVVNHNAFSEQIEGFSIVQYKGDTWKKTKAYTNM